MNNLQAKIDAIDRELATNGRKLWNIKEKRRILEAEIIELREKMFNINKEKR